MVPKLPQGAVVTIDFGFNGTNLTQVGATPRALSQGHCVNGLRGIDLRPGVVLPRRRLLPRRAPGRAAGKLVVPSAGTSPSDRPGLPDDA